MTFHQTSRRDLLKGAAIPVAALAGVPVFDVVGTLPTAPAPLRATRQRRRRMVRRRAARPHLRP